MTVLTASAVARALAYDHLQDAYWYIGCRRRHDAEGIAAANAVLDARLTAMSLDELELLDDLINTVWDNDRPGGDLPSVTELLDTVEALTAPPAAT